MRITNTKSFFTKLDGGTFFPKIDFSDVFLQMEVD